MEEQLEALQLLLINTTDLDERLDLAEQIHTLGMEIAGVKPYCSPNDDGDCMSCGS